MTDVQHMRRLYRKDSLFEADVPTSPMPFFSGWFEEACASEQPEPNTMVLSTVDAKGHPRARAVLLKEIHSDGGLVFFTNFESDKGRELDGNPYVSLVFVWHSLERQVRIEGTVERLTEADSDAYFATRPRESQLGAWASHQSELVEDRGTLEQRFHKNEARFEGQDVPRPAYWGGYVVTPRYVEFWQGRPGRMHDRLCFELQDDGAWSLSRRMP